VKGLHGRIQDVAAEAGTDGFDVFLVASVFVARNPFRVPGSVVASGPVPSVARDVT